MTVHLRHTDGAFGFEATNSRGNTVTIDTSAQQGGKGAGASPMELLAMAVGACSGMDVADILRKARQRVDMFEMDVEGTRPESGVPRPFTHLHVTYRLAGDIAPQHARRAVELGLRKYCSVAESLDKNLRLTAAVVLNGETIHDERTGA